MALTGTESEKLGDQLQMALRRVVAEEIQRYIDESKQRITDAIMERVKFIQTKVTSDANYLRGTMEVEIAIRTEPTADKLKEQIVSTVKEWVAKNKRHGGELHA